MFYSRSPRRVEQGNSNGSCNHLKKATGFGNGKASSGKLFWSHDLHVSITYIARKCNRLDLNLSILLDEKFTWRVPISRLVPLSLACGNSLHVLILKESQF